MSHNSGCSNPAPAEPSERLVDDVSAAGVASSERPAQAEQRRFVRRPVRWPALCTVASGVVKSVTVVDASEGGMGLSSDLGVPTQEAVSLHLPGIGTFECRVAWRSAERCGLQFLEIEGELTQESIAGLADVLTQVKSSALSARRSTANKG